MNHHQHQNEQLDLESKNHEPAELPLVVEIPTEIRAGVKAAAAAAPRNCSPYSSCYKIRAL